MDHQITSNVTEWIIIMDQDPLRNALICETLYDKEVPTSSLQTLA